MRVLVMSHVFPNGKQPAFGVFVRERALHVARYCDLRVVAPVPWFPMNSWIRGPVYRGIAGAERQDELQVYHPRFLSIPRVGKFLDGFLYAVSLLPFLSRLRRDFRFDVIDAHFTYPDGLAAVLLGRGLGRPVVITLRGSLPRLATYRLHRPQLKLALRWAARIISVSESLKQVATRLGIPGEHVRVIPNGVDTTCFAPMDKTKARRALGLAVDRPILISVGGINVGKGHHRVVGILPRLLRRRRDLLYVIVGGERGGDTSRPIIEQLIRSHGLQDHVLLVGERPHEEIATWLAASDLFCLATRSEGWCNAILEALACGRPVVTTRVGGNPEIVSDERYGLLVDPLDDGALADAILEGLDGAWRPEELATYARRFSWETTAQAVLEEFRKAAGLEGRVGAASGDTCPHILT